MNMNKTEHNDILKEMTTKYIWWMDADVASQFPDKVICQTMNFADLPDMKKIIEHFGEVKLKECLLNSEGDQLSDRSFNYWLCRLGLDTNISKRKRIVKEV